MTETPPLWLRALSYPPVLYLAAGVLIPMAIVWLVVLFVLWALGWMFHGVTHVVERWIGLTIPNPFTGVAAILSSGLYGALCGWFDEVKRRYGNI